MAAPKKAAAQKPAPRTRKNPSQRGDFTGNKKEALQKEHAEAVAERREELGMITAQQDRIEREGVVDMMGATPKLEMPANSQGDGKDEMVAGATKTEGTDDGEQLLTRAQWEEMLGNVDARPEFDLATHRVVTPEEPRDPQGTRLGGSETSIDVFELEPERARAAQQPGEVLDRESSEEPTLIRSIYTLDDVTIGYGNTFTFKENVKYRVPRWVAAHLEEKGLCDVLSLSGV